VSVRRSDRSECVTPVVHDDVIGPAGVDEPLGGVVDHLDDSEGADELDGCRTADRGDRSAEGSGDLDGEGADAAGCPDQEHGRSERSDLRQHAIQVPAAGDALQFVLPRILEREARPPGQILDVCEARTSEGPACAITQAPIDTDSPLHLLSTISHSPVCTPARTSIPSGRTARTIA
jgi:hypothetical protein